MTDSTPASSTPLISAQSLCFSVDQRQILQNVSLEIEKNQILTLIGPNGAGKTTLVKLILGLIKPDSGTIKRKPDLSIGYMPQRLQLDQAMPISVKHFLALAMNAKPKLIAKSLDEVGASSLLNSQIHGLSGGELQRVLLARALIQSPELLVLDEPVQGVDINGQTELYQLISRIRDEHNCGVLMVSHDLHLVMSQTDEVLCLNQHICCHGHPEQVSNDPAYLELFGKKQAEALAIYTHHHNHQHDLAGDIITPEDNHG